MDLPKLKLVEKAIRSGIGNIEWKDSALKLFLDDPRFSNYTPKMVRELLHEFVKGGGGVTQREEKRTEYKDEHPYWYRVLLPEQSPEKFRELFVELILFDDDEDDPYVRIVSVHY